MSLAVLEEESRKKLEEWSNRFYTRESQRLNAERVPVILEHLKQFGLSLADIGQNGTPDSHLFVNEVEFACELKTMKERYYSRIGFFRISKNSWKRLKNWSNGLRKIFFGKLILCIIVEVRPKDGEPYYHVFSSTAVEEIIENSNSKRDRIAVILSSVKNQPTAREFFGENLSIPRCDFCKEKLSRFQWVPTSGYSYWYCFHCDLGIPSGIICLT